MAIVVCVARTSLPHCHQLISEVTQAVSAQTGQAHDVIKVKHETQTEKRKQEVIDIIAQLKKRGRFYCW